MRQRKEGREGETVWGRSRRSGGGGGGHPDCSLADGTERTGAQLFVAAAVPVPPAGAARPGGGDGGFGVFPAVRLDIDGRDRDGSEGKDPNKHEEKRVAE